MDENQRCIRMKWKTRGLLFDMDGVLVSSIGSVERAWTRWAEMRGIDPALAIHTAHGRRAIESVRFLRPDVDADQDLALIEGWEVEDKEGLELLGGVMPILEHLPQKYWTIVTSATDRVARARIADAGVPLPPSIITGDMVTNGKPDPEPYVRGAQILGIRPEDCLVIEDSASGAKAGHAAGCKVLATTFSHSIESLSAADWIVDSLVGVTVKVVEDGLEVEFQPINRT